MTQGSQWRGKRGNERPVLRKVGSWDHTVWEMALDPFPGGAELVPHPSLAPQGGARTFALHSAVPSQGRGRPERLSHPRG